MLLSELRAIKTVYLANKSKLKQDFLDGKISEDDFKKERKRLMTEWIISKHEYYDNPEPEPE